MEALLSNEFVVLALDALLHLASVFVLGIVVIIACKLLTKGFVDAKLVTGLVIATLLVAMRVFLMNNVYRAFGDFDVIVSMAAIALLLFLTSLILVYKLVSIPLLGTILSSTVIVAAQLALAHYTPILSLKLMPEGQRFAEYAGVSNEKTKQLMERAKNFRGEGSSNISRILKEALASIASLTSEKEQKTLSKDLASGVQFIQERRAYTESMTEEELAEYRAAMSGFMEEQGVDLQNRYSLENLKHARPEDLQNLANFMKDMNQVYGFTEDLPQETDDGEDVPPTIESLKQIAQNLRGIDLGEENNREFANLLKNMMNSEEFGAEMSKVREQIADLKGNSGQLMETFRAADIEGMKRDLESTMGEHIGDTGQNINLDSLPFSSEEGQLGRGEKLFSQNLTSGFEKFGASIGRFASSAERLNETWVDPAIFIDPSGASQDEPTEIGANTSKITDSGFSAEIQAQASEQDGVSIASVENTNRVDYYMPVNTFSDFPEPQFENKPKDVEKQAAEEASGEISSDYFPDSELSSSLTEDFVLRAPKSAAQRPRWTEVADTIRIGAWFEGNGEKNKGTVFIDGTAYKSGEIIEREHGGKQYFFRFEGVQDGQVIIRSLKSEDGNAPDAADQGKEG